MKTSEIYLAGGCFWGVEHYFAQINGVEKTCVGYANGHTENPTYQEVCTQTTGFAETVHIVYNPEVISLNYLLKMYFDIIDPTSVNRQGGDVGDQYRTGIYYTNHQDLPIINSAIAKLQEKYDLPIAVEVKPLINFYKAEDYHQQYLEKNPGGYCHISPEKFKKARQTVVDPTRYEKPSEEELKEKLSETSFEITRQNGTEPPFNNEYWNHFEKGIYVDITTGEPLFTSSSKFNAHCGWPSFAKPISEEVITKRLDTSLGRQRVEVRSRVGDAHLGHVFTDGPEDMGGLRYCINSAALRFIKKEDMEKEGYGYLLPYVE